MRERRESPSVAPSESGEEMDHLETGDSRLAQKIGAMSEREIWDFVSRESQNRRLSLTVRTLNSDVLSGDLERRKRGEAAIRKLGFI